MLWIAVSVWESNGNEDGNPPNVQKEDIQYLPSAEWNELHLRISGRPSRASQVMRFIQYVKQHPNVWVARRIDIARWWKSEQCGNVDEFNG